MSDSEEYTTSLALIAFQRSLNYGRTHCVPTQVILRTRRTEVALEDCRAWTSHDIMTSVLVSLFHFAEIVRTQHRSRAAVLYKLHIKSDTIPRFERYILISLHIWAESSRLVSILISLSLISPGHDCLRTLAKRR